MKLPRFGHERLDAILSGDANDDSAAHARAFYRACLEPPWHLSEEDILARAAPLAERYGRWDRALFEVLMAAMANQ